MGDTNQFNVFLKEISPHRKRIKNSLYLFTLTEIFITLVVPVHPFTTYKQQLLIVLLTSLAIQWVYWTKIASIIKNQWEVLVWASGFTGFLTSAAYYSDGFFIIPPLIALVNVSVFFSPAQMVGLTVVLLGSVDLVFLIDLFKGATTPELFFTVKLLNIAIFSAGFSAALTTFEIKEREARMVRLEELDKIKSAFISIVSHNLRTPLSAISGYLEQLNVYNSNLTLYQRTSIENLQLNSRRLSDLIEHIIHITSIQTGDTQFRFDSVPVRDILKNVAAPSYLQHAKDKHLKVFLPTVPEHVVIEGDLKQLTRAFMQLFENAVKFTDKGSITVTVGKESGGILVSIQDTGKGMSEEFQKQLFTLFSRPFESVLQYEQTGVGLGLFMTKLIIEAHHGTIRVDSKLEKGTTYLIRLPFTHSKISCRKGGEGT